LAIGDIIKAAGFGLPPGINNRAVYLAYLFIKPMPGFLVNRFAYRAQFFKRAKIFPFTTSSPKLINERMAVGAVYNIFTLNFSTISHKRPAFGQVGNPLEHHGSGTL
jgi:hypothetical protein